MTTAPLHIGDLWGPGAYVGFAILIGFFFGFILERSGFGDGRNIVSVIYLRNFRVPKVMFSAILTVMAGSYLMGMMRIIDLSQVVFSHTWVLPMIVGGIIFGFGFVMGGYCPGTAVVSAVNRKLDGIFFILGIVAGVSLFAAAFKWIGNFYVSTDIGYATFPGYFRFNPGWFLLAALAFAWFFFGFGNRMEAYWAERGEKVEVVDMKGGGR